MADLDKIKAVQDARESMSARSDWVEENWHTIQTAVAVLEAMCQEQSTKKPPELLSPKEKAEMLKIAEHLWKDLQENNLGGYSGINRPFWIMNVFKEIIEMFGNRDVGRYWSQKQLNEIDKTAQPTAEKLVQQFMETP